MGQCLATVSKQLRFPFLLVICILEASGKWPEDTNAIKRLKAAFHIKLGEILKAKYELTNSVFPTHVDVLKVSYTRTNIFLKQECIPVGCVPTATVAVCWGGVCLSACWDTPPPGCGPGDTSSGSTPQPPHWVWAWRPARHAGIPPPPVNRLTDRCKNITLPQTSFVGNNK